MKLKRKLLSLITVFFVVFTCVYFTNDVSAAEEPIETKFVGTINDQFGYPVEGAEILLKGKNDTVLASATTDADGNYSLTTDKIVKGSVYVFEWTKDGYNKNISKPQEFGIIGVTIRMNMQLSRIFDKLTILGDVTDTDGSLISDATVVFKDLDGKVVTTVKTDDKGYYECSSDLLKAGGVYELYAEKDRYFTDKSKPVKVYTTTNELGYNSDLQIVKMNVRIHGIVKDYHGEALEGAKVIIEDRNGKIAVTAKTGKDGSYSILTDTLNDLSYAYYVQKDGYVTSDKQAMTIDPKHTVHDANMALKKIATTVNGVVKDANGKVVSDAKVVVEDENGKAVIIAKTNENGNYTITSDLFDAGKNYTLHAEKAGYYVGKDVTLTTVKDDYAYDANLSIKEYDEKTIYGTVVDGKGDKVEGAKVFIKDAENRIVATLTTDENGYYTVSDKMFAGYDKLWVHAEKENYSFKNNYTVVEITEAENKYFAPFVLYKELLEINIKDSNGKALDKVAIRDEKGNTIAETNEYGNAYFKFDDSEIHEVKFFKQGYEYVSAKVQNGKEYSIVMDKQVIFQAQSEEDRTLEGVKIIDENGKVIGVTGDDGWVFFKLADDKVHTVTIVKDGYFSQTRQIQNGKGYIALMEKASFTIYGTVTDDKGNKLEGVNVIIEDTRGNKLGTVKTGKGGKYVITSEKFVEYDGFLVHGEKEGYTFNNHYTVVTVEEGQYDYSASIRLYEEVVEVKEVNVTVKDTDGKVLDAVEIKDENGKVIATVKDGKVTFVFADDKAHKVTFVKEGYIEYPAELQNGKDYEITLEKVKEEPEDKPVPPTEPEEKPEDKPVPPTEPEEKPVDKPEVDVPQTDDTTSTVALVAIMLLCAGGFVVLNKKKKDEE